MSLTKIQSGADPNLKLEDGRTALHFAAIHGNKNTLRTLLQNGGDPHVVDNEGIIVYNVEK